MTNSEAVEILRNGFSFSHNRGFINASNAVVRAINALEENTKLKAEIEQLKGEREWCPNTRIEEFDKKTEIEQLKSELEQSVNFPLTNADKIRSMSDEELAEFIKDVWCDNHGYFVDKLLSKSATPIYILEMLKSEASNE